jgi:4-hydroxy-tetrahydrodipicolinate reductase
MELAKLAVIGDGKMGRAVAALAPDVGFDVVAVLGEAEVVPRGISRQLLRGAAVAIEFTVPAAAAGIVRGCIAASCPVVSGTTAWDAERHTVEAEVRAGDGAFLWAPNFAIGVHLFSRIGAQAALVIAKAPAPFDAHIVETHHAAKVDAPSGTARLLAARAAQASGREIGITSVRTGAVPGEHTVIFDAPFEQIRLEHVARDRRVFAAGALTAAHWLIGKRGVFTLDHVLGTAS